MQGAQLVGANVAVQVAAVAEGGSTHVAQEWLLPWGRHQDAPSDITTHNHTM